MINVMVGVNNELSFFFFYTLFQLPFVIAVCKTAQASLMHM
jgi:hypothetical protein